jgi:cytochrome o ubiquinol oxidase subunit 3
MDLTHDTQAKTLFGFWAYVMTDCILFATLFATYAVLHNGSFKDPGFEKLFSYPSLLVETLCLLGSSFTCGLAMMRPQTEHKHRALFWFFITFLLGASFIFIEVSEFTHFAQEGYGWQRNGITTSFCALVGTHGLHVSLGLFWMLFFMIELWKEGFTPLIIKRLLCLKLFWHFLDLIWIFIFTFVYLLEAVK